MKAAMNTHSFFLLYSSHLLLVTLRDIIHRDRNDVMNAIKATDLWYAVLFASVVYNVNYGPWEGGGGITRSQKGRRLIIGNGAAQTMICSETFIIISLQIEFGLPMTLLLTVPQFERTWRTLSFSRKKAPRSVSILVVFFLLASRHHDHTGLQSFW